MLFCDKKNAATLYAELPAEVRTYLERCPTSNGVEDLRDKFTGGVVFWNSYWADLQTRGKRKSRKNDQKGSKWRDDCSSIDEFLKVHKPEIWMHFNYWAKYASGQGEAQPGPGFNLPSGEPDTCGFPKGEGVRCFSCNCLGGIISSV